MEEAVLNTLRIRMGSYVSGEELSHLAGVSRTAIWKDIQKLRSEGYRILAQPHIGYQLVSVPDRLTPQELTWNAQTQRIGRRVYAYETTDSTMDVAHRLAQSGEPEGTVVVAETQSKGRGRLGRRWFSPAGKGIYASILLRPSLQLSSVPLIPLMTAVAVARAVEAETALKPEVKWPNDLLMGGKKFAGILTELNAELNRVHYLILGIGINVNNSHSTLPGYATSLAQTVGHRIDRLSLARALFHQVDHGYAQFLEGGIPSILEEWRRCATFLGKRVRVMTEGRHLDGHALDIDPSGALLVRTDHGFVESVAAGQVLVVQ